MDSMLVETPVKEQVSIVIDPTPEQLVIMEMIQLVKEGRWCRNRMTDDHQRHCALGMIPVAYGKAL